MRKILSVIIALVLCAHVGAQPCQIQFSGHVEDRDTKEKLSFATVRIVELDSVVITNSEGDFKFNNLCLGTYTLTITHTDCDTIIQKINLAKSTHFDFFLPHAHNTLGEVTVSATQAGQNTGMKADIAGRQLQLTRGQSFSEALSKINGVSLLQTGTNVSKPVIHGLHSSRVLIVNNGVRQEGQQWGNEHAPEVDLFLADNLSVIKGVDELKYGSDAIGGVVLVNPKPLRRLPGYYAEANTGYHTNNGLFYLSGMYERQPTKLPALNYRLQATTRLGANAQTPGYRLNNTALKEYNFSATVGWRKDQWNIEAFYSRFYTQTGIFTGAHVGNLTDLMQAIEAPRPGDVYLGENTYKIQRPYQQVIHHLGKLSTALTKGKHKFNLQVAAQLNQREEYDVARGGGTGPQMQLTALTVSEDLNWNHPRMNNISGTIGLAAIQQQNTVKGRYLIPNYDANTWGAYWIEKWTKNKWDLQGGVRYDFKQVNTLRLPFNQQPIRYHFDFSTWASSVNIIHRFTDRVRANLSFTFSSRAPHVNELLSDGLHHGTATFETGLFSGAGFNAGNIKTEQSFHTAVGMQVSNTARSFNLNLLAYYNMIDNFVYQQPLPGSPVLTISGAFPHVAFRQTAATISGGDVTINWKVNNWLEYTGKLAVVRGYNRNIDDWLVLMPADRFTNDAAISLPNLKQFTNNTINIEVPLVAEQKRLPDETKHGKQDYKAPPAGYALVNLNASTTLAFHHVPITIMVGANNLLNHAYRDYLNQFRYFTDETGRNITIRIKLTLQNHTHKH